MPKKCEDPHERRRTHSLPEEAINQIYDFFQEWEKELNVINIYNVSSMITFLTKMGIPAAKHHLEQIRTEQGGITRKTNPSQQNQASSS